MSDRFKDVYLVADFLGTPCISSPRWSTDLVMVDSGAERVNQRWAHPLHTYTLPQAIRNHNDIEAVHDHWMVMRGPLYTWPFRDPLDFASVALELPNVEPTISATDQSIGTGDGLTQAFQLKKTYTRGAQTYTRNIYLPIESSLIVALDGTPTVAFSTDRETGIITFTAPPSPGVAITAGFYFDVPVRFESDDAFGGIVQTYNVSGVADLTLVEVRQC